MACPRVSPNPSYHNSLQATLSDPRQETCKWQSVSMPTANSGISRWLILWLNGPTVTQTGIKLSFITWPLETFPLTEEALWHFGSADINFISESLFSAYLPPVPCFHGKMATGSISWRWEGNLEFILEALLPGLQGYLPALSYVTESVNGLRSGNWFRACGGATCPVSI